MVKNSFFSVLIFLNFILFLNHTPSSAKISETDQTIKGQERANNLGCFLGSCNTCSCYSKGGSLIAEFKNTGFCNGSGRCTDTCSPNANYDHNVCSD